MKNDYNTVIWENVRLKNGVNIIEVKAMNGKILLHDEATWTLTLNE